jgi:16S rRNA (cytidine1402-2'-O)-methyltransferase
MQQYLDQGLTQKEAMRRVAADRGLSRRDIYQQIKVR